MADTSKAPSQPQPAQETQSPSRDFTQSAEVSRRASIGTHVEPSQITTKAEVDRLEAMRARAEPHPTPKPANYDHAAADQSLSRANEARLNRHRTSLMVAHVAMRRDRLHNVHEGRAKAAFNAKRDPNQNNSPDWASWAVTREQER